MTKKRLYNQNEDDELEELEDDSELKELGEEDLEGEIENPKNPVKDEDLEETEEPDIKEL